VFCIYLRTNSDLCHLQHKLIGFYNRVEKYLLRGTEWAFKRSSLRSGGDKNIKLPFSLTLIPEQNALEMNPGLLGETTMANRLNNGKALWT
jgi:hypothetical protein